MADISKCSGKDCPLKSKCYRYLAIAGKYQWYQEPAYKDGKCEDYWER